MSSYNKHKRKSQNMDASDRSGDEDNYSPTIAPNDLRHRLGRNSAHKITGKLVETPQSGSASILTCSVEPCSVSSHARNVIESRASSGNKKMKISADNSTGGRSDTRIVVNKMVFERIIVTLQKDSGGSSDEESYSPKKGMMRSVIVRRSEDEEMPALEDTSRKGSSQRGSKITSIQKLRLQELKKTLAEKKRKETPTRSGSKSYDDDYNTPGPFGSHKTGKKNKSGAKVLYLPPHLRGEASDDDADDDDNNSKGYSSKKSKKYSEIQSIKSRLAEVDKKIKMNSETEESVMLQKDSEILKIRSKARPSGEGVASSDSEMLRHRTKVKSSKLDDESEILRLREKSKKRETNTSSDSEMLRQRSKAHPKPASVTEEEEILKLRRNQSSSESEGVTSSDSDILRIRRNLSNPDLKKQAGSSKSWADIVDEEEEEEAPRTKGRGRGVSSRGYHRSRRSRYTPDLEDDDEKPRKAPQSEPRKRVFNFNADSPSKRSIKQRLSLGDTTSESYISNEEWFESKTSRWQKDTGKSRYEMFKQESEPKESFQDAANSWRNQMKGSKRGKNNVWGKQSDSAASKDHTDASLSYQERLDALRGKCAHMYSKPGGMDNISWKTGNWKAQFQRRFQNLPQIPYIDTHCHIDFLFQRTHYQGSFAEYLEENAETVPSSFAGCVAVFCNPSTYHSEKNLFLSLMDEHNIHGAVGVHPKSATDFNPRIEKQMRWMLEHDKVVALGEIGLDYSGTFYQRAAIQKRVFIKQLKMAEELDLPIVIHCRDAEEDCVNILEQTIDRNHTIHRHCWTGNWEDCEIWMDKFPNSFVGLTPLVTQSTDRAIEVREVAARLPLDRLLLETDAPYFLPSCIPKDAMKFTHPALAITVATEVAALQDVPVEEVLSAVAENTYKMYGIKPQLN